MLGKEDIAKNASRDDLLFMRLPRVFCPAVFLTNKGISVIVDEVRILKPVIVRRGVRVGRLAQLVRALA